VHTADASAARGKTSAWGLATCWCRSPTCDKGAKDLAKEIAEIGRRWRSCRRARQGAAACDGRGGQPRATPTAAREREPRARLDAHKTEDFKEAGIKSYARSAHGKFKGR